MLITADKDFSELVSCMGRIHNGVVLIRISYRRAVCGHESTAKSAAGGRRWHGRYIQRVFLRRHASAGLDSW